MSSQGLGDPYNSMAGETLIGLYLSPGDGLWKSSPLARIHRRYDFTAAEWAIGAREVDGAGTISGKWGQCLSSAAAGRTCDRLGTLGRARWRGEDAARDSRGAGWRELAGTFGCPLGGSGTGVAVRQEVESLAVGPGRG